MTTGTPKKTAARKPGPKAAIAIVSADSAPALPEKADADKGGGLRKKELLARVTALVGGKKSGVKEVVEATLTTLGEALQNGEGFNLPPFGKARIAKSKGEGKSLALTIKLRGAGAKQTARGKKQALAEDGEDS